MGHEEDPQLPKKLGKYEIVRHVGSGSMASVYLGHDPFIDRQVAIKVAHPKFMRDEKYSAQYRKMFFNEARIAGMLDNRFILPVYDAGLEGDLLYIVMEFVDGALTLKNFAAPGRLLPVPKVLEIVYKCCRALDYAHSRGVVHRDIKSSNILVTEDHDIRVADFGIAQIIKGDDTQVVGLMGSPRYMSPEQLQDRPLTNQTDIYSLGVVMYELLTGRFPFDAETLPALVRKIMHEEPPLMSTHNPQVPGYLEMIMKRTLSKNTASRYPTCLDLAADVSQAFKQHKHSVLAADTSRQERFEKLKKLSFFQGFFDSEVMEVIDASEWGEFTDGAVIISEGDLDDSLYIIVGGTVTVQKGGSILTRLGAGDCFGEMAYFSKARRTASIVAEGPVMLTKVNSTLIDRASTNCQLRFLKTFLRTLIERLSSTSSKLAK
jgi:serine/threonine protein kinase